MLPLGKFIFTWLVLVLRHHHTEFEVSLQREGLSKSWKGFTWPGPHLLWGNLFLIFFSLATTWHFSQCTKFKMSAFTHSRDRMVPKFKTRVTWPRQRPLLDSVMFRFVEFASKFYASGLIDCQVNDACIIRCVKLTVRMRSSTCPVLAIQICLYATFMELWWRLGVVCLEQFFGRKFSSAVLEKNPRNLVPWSPLLFISPSTNLIKL